MGRSAVPLLPPREEWPDIWRDNTNPIANSHPEAFADPFEALFRIQRGLAGHVSYLATRDGNIVFTEYLLYEPILAILQTQNYAVQCEVPCQGLEAAPVGDSRKIDFVATKAGVRIALEVKWLRWDDDDVRDYLDIKSDTRKLIAALNAGQANHSFLCVFGRHSQTSVFHGGKAQAQIAKFVEALPPVYADFRRTAYGARIFQLKPDQVADG